MGFPPSGNCHKAALAAGRSSFSAASFAGSKRIGARNGATRTYDYLSKNPNGKVPMIELEDGRIMVESNAILYWLAEGTQFFQARRMVACEVANGLDVFRAIQPRALYRRRAFHLRMDNARWIPRVAPICRSCAVTWLSGAGCDGKNISQRMHGSAARSTASQISRCLWVHAILGDGGFLICRDIPR